MTEQTEMVTNTSKTDHSEKYACCRLSYDCLMASTKSFVNNFNNLSLEEKQQFKSLHNYVKQLEKCMLTIRNNQPKITTVKRSPKTEQKEQSVSTSVPVQVQVPVSVSGPVSSVAVLKSKKVQGKGNKTAKEDSPTAEVVKEVHAESALEATKVTTTTSKRGKSQKQVSPVVSAPVVSNVSTPASSNTSVSEVKKTQIKKANNK